MLIVDMLLGQFEKARSQGAFLEQQDVVQNPAVTPVPSGYSLLKKVERIHDILAAKSITPNDKKIQFQAMLSGGLDLPSLRTPDTQDVQYGLFPWVAKRPIANDSLLHQLARIYGTKEEASTFGFSPFEVFMMYYVETRGAVELTRFLHTYSINVPDFDAAGPLSGISRRFESMSLYHTMSADGKHRLASFQQQMKVGSSHQLPVLTEAFVLDGVIPKP